MADIVDFDGNTKRDIMAQIVLQSALDTDLNHAVVVGREKDGRFYFASSHGDGAQTLLLLEQAKHDLLERLKGN